MIKRCLSRRPMLAGWGLGVVVAVAALLFAAPAPAATPPTIDGNLTDMITFVNQVIAEKIGNGLTKADPAKDVCKSDASIFPCPAGNEEPCPTDPVNRTYFKNGYDLILAVAAYDQSNQTMYLGIRAAGVIGDVDGDQTAGDGGCAPPPGKLDINDGNGIGNNETYIFNVDFDCGQNGVNELRIEVDNGTLFVNDVAQPAGNWAFNGSDLEIKIPGVVVPEMWSISVKTGASEDGLEEETIQEKTPPPALDLTIVKSAEPTVICPNGNTVFTVTVTNTGAAALDVNLVDALPAQLSFVSLDPSSDFVLNPNPPATPQNLVFATLNMAPGAVKIAKFTAHASAECFGAVENVATVTGVFNSACLAGGEPATVGPLEARATVVCKAQPCVDNVQCEVPQTVCVGQNYTVTGKARNCSPDPEDITITIKTGAGAVLKTQKFVGVGPGQVATLVSDPISCAAPGVNNYVIEAKAENECGATDVVTSECSVTCTDVAKLSVLCMVSATEAQNGDVITVTGKATNTSTAVENITLRVFGPTGTVLCEQTFNGVAPGAEVSLPCQVTVECEPDQTVTYKVDALAVNDCGQERKETSESCSVYCPPQGTNCPRTVGFWGQQCAQKTGGSTKFTKDEVTQIAACIDAESAAFDWSNDFDGFCANINPPRPMDCKKQAHRQFAALLANYCTGKLALIANNGNEISLDPSSPNPCKDSFPDAMNLGELIDAMDAKLVELNGMGADAMDHGYCMVSECADGINNGRGIAIDPDCSEEYSYDRTAPRGDLGTSGAGSTSGIALELYRPTPNPFTNSTSVAYAVGGNGQDVQIGIYDVAGRLVRTLASGFQAAGRYEVKWNGRGDNGTEVTHGVYFVRALVDGQRVNEASRILYLR